MIECTILSGYWNRDRFDEMGIELEKTGEYKGLDIYRAWVPEVMLGVLIRGMFQLKWAVWRENTVIIGGKRGEYTSSAGS